MTREELDELLAAASGASGAKVERVEPKQYEPETVRITCPHCQTPFRILRWQHGAPWVDRHIAECATRTAEQRAFYRAKRRWPTAELVAETPPKSHVQRQREYEARHGITPGEKKRDAK